jgi:hypothetical protein
LEVEVEQHRNIRGAHSIHLENIRPAAVKRSLPAAVVLYKVEWKEGLCDRYQYPKNLHAIQVMHRSAAHWQ